MHWKYTCTHAWTNGWINRRTDGRIDDRTNFGTKSKYFCSKEKSGYSYTAANNIAGRTFRIGCDDTRLCWFRDTDNEYICIIFTRNPMILPIIVGSFSETRRYLRAILCKYGASYIGTISRSDSDFDDTC